MRSSDVGTILLVLFTLHKTVSSTCTSPAQQLPGLSLRSVNNSVTSHNSHIKDGELAERWYRPETANLTYRMSMIKDGIPDLGQCGTQNPIYLEGTLPKLQEGKELILSACYVTWDSNCAKKIEIKVRVCSGQTQYYLRPPPGISAYCFESEAPTAAPNYRIPGTPRVIPGMFYTPKKAKGKTYQIPNLEFTCQFQQDARWYYHVQWHARVGHDDKIIKSFPLTKNLSDVKLKEEHLLTKNIHLGTTSESQPQEQEKTTKPAYSEYFLIGIKVLTPTTYVNQGGTGTLRLQQTVPFGCVSSGGRDCTTLISLYNVNTTYQCQQSSSAVAVRDVVHCGKELKGLTYEQCKNGCPRFTSRTYSLTIETKQLISYNMKTNFDVLLKTDEFGVSHEIWKNYKVSNAHVVVRESNTWYRKTCKLIADPEIITFDGRMYYSTTTSNVGEFLLYENKQYPLQVQYKTFPCARPGIGTCTCGVVIRGGGDLWMYNTCNRANFIGFVSCHDSVLRIEKITETHYTIHTPIGTYMDVQMKVGQNYLDVLIYASPADTNNTIGHCGKLNGNQRDDIYRRDNGQTYSGYTSGGSVINTFFNTWKLSTSESYFRSNNWNPTNWNKAFMTCMCNYTKGFESKVFCSPDKTTTCHMNNTEPICNPRKKRSLSKRVRMMKGDEMQHVQLPTKLFKRAMVPTTISNVSFREAYAKCEEFFTSRKIYALKDTVPEAKLNLSLLSCANDASIDITQTSWMSSHFEGWALSIQNEIKRNITYQKTSTTAMKTFEDSYCPDECNSNGKCIQGTCVCDKGYAGSTCFIEKAAILYITDIEGDGVCDISIDDDCHECLQVKTEYLLQNFSCNITAQELDKHGLDLITTRYQSFGELENLFEGRCCPRMANRRKREADVPLTFVTKYMVSVSNDGVHFGPQRNVYVYDSTCQMYTKMSNNDFIFSLKSGHCYINGRCYQRGQTFISCSSMCLPEFDKFEWSQVMIVKRRH